MNEFTSGRRNAGATNRSSFYLLAPRLPSKPPKLILHPSFYTVVHENRVPKRQTGLYYKVGYKVTAAPRGGHLGRPRQSGGRVSPAPGTRTRASTRVTAGLPSSIGKERSVSSHPPPQARGAKVTGRAARAAESIGIEIPLLVCREFYVGVKSPSGHGLARVGLAFPPPKPRGGLAPRSGELAQANGARRRGSETPPFSA